MINESGLFFIEIQSEEYRTYKWSDGFEVTIKNPTHLNVSKSGGHRLLDKEGKSPYVQSGWRYLYWKAFDGKPNFVK